ncbi:Hpt domain-containing protein [Roseospira navarrensis]|uniref:HPt domain-containing protein n=1 Tax=Roseospira navarrensis TaxID=140058 RepID=A0A7X1ZE86_9PROT|nr:Hpt domain-containing protein [Roseospira navarrensis]MQX35971.1 hypothetical protein [Roseospira navarrensis]
MTAMDDGDPALPTARPTDPLRQAVAAFPPTAATLMSDLTEGLDAAARATEPAPLDDALGRVAAAAHKLAGSAGSMGYESLGRMAAALERLTEGVRADPTHPTDAAWAQARSLAGGLAKAVASLTPEQSSLLAPRPGPPTRDGPALSAPFGALRVAVIGPGSETTGEGLADRLALYGWTVVPLSGVQAAMEEAAGAPAPDLAVVDLDAAPDAVDRMAALTGPDGDWPALPWLATCARPGPGTWRAVVTAGGLGLLAAPLTADALIARVAALEAAHDDDMSRVLILDPDPVLADLLRQALEDVGTAPDVATEPTAALHAVERGHDEGGVDVLVIIERTGREAGLDLACALDGRGADLLPGLVLVLPDGAPTPAGAALAACADAVTAWPLDLEMIAATVRAQAARARARRRTARTEGDGPVLVRTALDLAVSDLMRRARDLDLPLALVWMRAEGESPAETEGLLAQLIQAALRPGDLLGRGPDGGLVAVPRFLDRAGTEALLRPVAGRLAALAPGTTLSWGLATLEADGDTDAPARLMARARDGASPVA